MRLGVQRPALGVAAVFLAATLACNGDPAEPGQGGNGGNNPNPNQVSVVDNSFNPSSVSINVGGTVTWTWMGINPHNVTFDDATIGNSVTQSTGTFNATFPDAGSFTYICTIHGRAVMSGTVVVQ